MVADGNRHHDDRSGSGRCADEARVRDTTSAGNHRRRRGSQGKSVGVNEGGFLVLKRPWPSMMRTIYGDPERFRKQYWSDIEGVYFTGDGARRDEDGYFWIMGRIDDVINVSGHRIGTMEVESALVSHPTVAEAAVVGRPDDLKGQGIVAFVTLAGGHSPAPGLKDELKIHVGKAIGSFAKPDEIRFTDAPAQNAQRKDHAAASARPGFRCQQLLATPRHWRISRYWRN